MAGRLWLLILLMVYCTRICGAITNVHDVISNVTELNGVYPPAQQDFAHCGRRISRALQSMSRRRSGVKLRKSGDLLPGGDDGSPPHPIELTGYALHHPMRSAPYEMYVTDMKLRAPGARLDRCRYDPGIKTLQARLLFRDVTVTGRVRLSSGESTGGGGGSLIGGVEDPSSSQRCDMTLRMKRAGLGFTVLPADRNGVSTATTFVEPQFVSVHAYGCKGLEEAKSPREDGPEARSDEYDLDMRQEMEEVFLRGVRSLLSRYMEHQLHPALRDTLMMNLGYSLSYGRRKR